MSSKGNGEGSVYNNKQRKKWNALFKEYNTLTGKMKYKTKSFKTENEAKKYLNTIMYQKENPIYIEHNGIPLVEILKANLELKHNTNQIGPAQYGRTLNSIKRLEKYPIANKKIDTI